MQTRAPNVQTRAHHTNQGPPYKPGPTVQTRAHHTNQSLAYKPGPPTYKPGQVVQIRAHRTSQGPHHANQVPFVQTKPGPTVTTADVCFRQFLAHCQHHQQRVIDNRNQQPVASATGGRGRRGYQGGGGRGKVWEGGSESKRCWGLGKGRQKKRKRRRRRRQEQEPRAERAAAFLCSPQSGTTPEHRCRRR